MPNSTHLEPCSPFITSPLKVFPQPHFIRFYSFGYCWFVVELKNLECEDHRSHLVRKKKKLAGLLLRPSRTIYYHSELTQLLPHANQFQAESCSFLHQLSNFSTLSLSLGLSRLGRVFSRCLKWEHSLLGRVVYPGLKRIAEICASRAGTSGVCPFRNIMI